LRQNGRVEVGADQPLGRTGLLDLGDQRRASGLGEAPGQGGAEAAWRRGFTGARLDGVL